MDFDRELVSVDAQLEVTESFQHDLFFFGAMSIGKEGLLYYEMIM